jgi:hypothetical protein
VRKYKRDFKDDPTWTPYALKERVKKDLNINVLIQRCYRAKREALRQVFGSHSGQYHLTRRYANAIRLTNPGSSAFIQRDRPFFQRMYISLDACKKGLLTHHLLRRLPSQGGTWGAIAVCHRHGWQ